MIAIISHDAGGAEIFDMGAIVALLRNNADKGDTRGPVQSVVSRDYLEVVVSQGKKKGFVTGILELPSKNATRLT